MHWAGRSERLALLDSVGGAADGSLLLAETLSRATEVVVPTFGDVCILDAIDEGRVSRIAVRAEGGEDAPAIEAALRQRTPALPESGPRRALLATHPAAALERPRRGAPPDGGVDADLEFLRRRAAVVDRDPDPARDRNLGALTLITAWSRRSYNEETSASRSSPAASGWRSTTPGCSPTSRASSGG